jgi:hypothetical protein
MPVANAEMGRNVTGEHSDPPKLPPEAGLRLPAARDRGDQDVRESQKVDLKTAKDVVESTSNCTRRCICSSRATASSHGRAGFSGSIAALLVWVAMTYIAKF